jgi:hypothetical protein
VATRVAALGVAIALALVGIGLARGGGADWFLHLGKESPALPLARHVLGDDVAVPLNDRHDGETFWVLARDPLLRQGEDTGKNFDHPAYRAQRILYPWLASPWRAFGEDALLWGLIATNVVAFGIGSYALTKLALASGSVWRAGLAFALNPLSIVALLFDLSDAVALALLAIAMLLLQRSRVAWAVVAGVAAVLAKDTSLFGLVGIALLHRRLDVRSRLALGAVPAAAGVAWGVYARWRLGWPPSTLEAWTAVPFRGFVDAYRDGWSPNHDWLYAFLGVLLVPLAVLVVARWWRSRSLVMAAALPYALIVPFLSKLVVDLPQNTVRAVGPALSFLVIDLLRDDDVASSRCDNDRR